MLGKRKSVLFVCTRNVCRSAIAEAVFREFLRRKKKRQIRVRSAGIRALAGTPATDYAVESAKHLGISIRRHRARKLSQRDIDWAGLILVMSRDNENAIRRDFRRWGGKVFLLSEMIGTDFDVKDIYGESIYVYVKSAAQIAAIIEQGFDRIMTLLGTGIAEPEMR